MKRTALFAALALAACQQEAAPNAPVDNEVETLQPPATGAPNANEVVALNEPVATNDAAGPTEPEEQASDDWRKYAKDADADRLRRLNGAWETALKKARVDHATEVTKMGWLGEPDAKTLPNPHPAPGDYRCSTYKLGGIVGFATYPAFKCRIELTPGGDLKLTKLTGSQRTAGQFYPSSENDHRLVYLGGQAWGLDQKTATAYGEDAQRDQIGVLERIGENRWRLVLPWPRVESDLDILELRK